MLTSRLADLGAELASDPQDLGLTQAGDGEAAELLNAMSRSVARDVPLGALQGLLVSRGRWAALSQFAAGARPEGESGALWDAVVGMRDLIMAGQATVVATTEPTDAALFAAQLQALVGASLLSADDRTALLALGLQPGSRAEELGLGSVTPSDVAAARRLIGAGL